MSTRGARRQDTARHHGRAAGGAIAAILVLATACDPCAGVAACRGSSQLSVGGQIVDRGNPTDADRAQQSGAGIPEPTAAAGVRVEVVPTGGAAHDAQSAATTTDGTGWWSVSIPVAAEGSATVDVVVTPAAGAGYRVHDVPVLASRTRGQGNVLGRWTRDLFLTAVGEVYDAASGARVDSARVTAVRRAGIAIEPTSNTTTPMITFGGGRFLYDVRPLADGPLVLDFTIERAGLPAARIDSLTIYPEHEWVPPNVSGGLVFRIDSAGHRVLP